MTDAASSPPTDERRHRRIAFLGLFIGGGGLSFWLLGVIVFVTALSFFVGLAAMHGHAGFESEKAWKRGLVLGAAVALAGNLWPVLYGMFRRRGHRYRRILFQVLLLGVVFLWVWGWAMEASLAQTPIAWALRFSGPWWLLFVTVLASGWMLTILPVRLWRWSRVSAFRQGALAGSGLMLGTFTGLAILDVAVDFREDVEEPPAVRKTDGRSDFRPLAAWAHRYLYDAPNPLPLGMGEGVFPSSLSYERPFWNLSDWFASRAYAASSRAYRDRLFDRCIETLYRRSVDVPISKIEAARRRLLKDRRFNDADVDDFVHQLVMTVCMHIDKKRGTWTEDDIRAYFWASLKHRRIDAYRKRQRELRRTCPIGRFPNELACPWNPEDEQIAAEELAIARSAIETLPPLEQHRLIECFGVRERKAVARDWDVSASRVTQVCQDLVKKVRRVLKLRDPCARF